MQDEIYRYCDAFAVGVAMGVMGGWVALALLEIAIRLTAP